MDVLAQIVEKRYAAYNADSVELTKNIPDNSIHYTLFSPPFSSLYTYSNSDRDMGNCKGDDEFIDHFKFLAKELYRITIPGRLLSFHCMDLPLLKSKDGVIGLKDFPAIVRQIFEDCGFIYHSRVTIWKNPVTEMQRTKALGLLHKQIRKDSSMCRQGVADYIITLRKPGDNPEMIPHTHENFPVNVWQQYASPVWMDIRQSDTLQRTSARTMNAVEITRRRRNWLLKKVFKLDDKETRRYMFVSGTRRTTLKDYSGGWYGSNQFREKYHNFFKTRLPKGVEVFYEIVGYIDNEKTIMGRCSNSKVDKLNRNKEFTKQYGEETVFSYGCEPGQNECYVYRMTMTNEDGYVVELPWERVVTECEKMGVNCVPTFEKFIFTTWDDLMQRVERWYDGVDPIGKTHIKEGVVVRIDNRTSFTAFKHKNIDFKILEGIIKDNADAPDMEEAEDLIVENAGF